jgi:hypothetical protein
MTYDVGVGIILSALDSALGRSFYMILCWVYDVMLALILEFVHACFE